MRIYLSLSIALITIFNSYSQGSYHMLHYTANKEYVLNNFIKTYDQKYLTTGFVVYGINQYYSLISKIDQAGHPEWIKLYYDTTSFICHDLSETPDSNYILCGSLMDSSYTNSIALLKIDSQGNIIWNKRFQSNINETANNITINTDGSYTLCGAGNVSNMYYFTIIRIDSFGNLIWTKNYERPFSYSDNTDILSLDNNSNIVTVKYDTTILVLNIDQWGSIIWSNTYSYNDIYINSISKTFDNNIIILGGRYNDILFKINTNGDIIWAKKYNSLNQYGVYYSSITNTSDSCSVFTSTHFIPMIDSMNISIIKIDNNGDTLWTRKYGNTDYYIGGEIHKIAEDFDSGYILMGKYTDVNRYGYILKTNHTGYSNCYNLPTDFSIENIVVQKNTISLVEYNTTYTQYINNIIPYNQYLLDSLICFYSNINTNSFNNKQITVFPNPSSKEINIICKNMQEIELINENGQLIEQYNVNSDKFVINVANRNKGIYFVKVETINGNVIEKIVVN
ncbi:MAG: hypothetical protein Kow0068_14780 [Marinilabiliales bacterium]